MTTQRFLAFTIALVTTGFVCESGSIVGSDAEYVPVEAEQLVRLVNDHRAALGCPALEWHLDVASVADLHSQDMLSRDFFDHTNPDGLNPFDRLEKAGVRYRLAAENIAAGQSTAEQVFGDWLASSGHRRNIENCGYSHHGVGLASNRWTHMFVTPR